MSDEYPGPERRTPGDRREDSAISVRVDGLDNGALKLARWFLGLASAALVFLGAWMIRTEIRVNNQEDMIRRTEHAMNVVDQALSQGQAETLRTVRQVIDEQKEMQADIQQNRNGLGVLDAEKDAIRRDFEREHGNGVPP